MSQEIPQEISQATSQKTSLLFLVTGVSSGLGKAIAGAALDAGHKIAGIVRRQEDAAAFEATAPGRATAIRLDVIDTDAIAPAVAKIEKEIGPIDVLVNNAGYGHEGVLEESTMAELRHQFEVNTFAPVAFMQAVLPYMRARRAGRIVNVTSMGGIITMPGISFYHGSKFALEGIGESLGKEVRELGIFVTAVEPGGFRTDWAGRSMVRAGRSIADYDAIFDPVRERRQGYSGRQAGDPARLGKAVLELVRSENPPAHLLLGSDALRLVRDKLASLNAEIEAWEDVSISTDFQEA
ncbi:oxidoreductase [Neorhizobium sp. DT-125]|uniref:oxidoreductase n=1 Tax=Neorhizobium sp. DT-125 TaxID=3396163 RepID=UPI003F1B6CAE